MLVEARRFNVHCPRIVVRALMLLSALAVMAVLFTGAMSVRATAATPVPLPSTSPAAPAQAPVEIPEDLRPDQVDPLLAGMTDAQARAALAAKLRARAAQHAEAPKDGGIAVAIAKFRQNLEGFSETLATRLGVVAAGLSSAWHEVPAAVSSLIGRDPAQGAGFVLTGLALMLGLAIAVFLLLRGAMRGARARLEAVSDAALADRLTRSGLRALLDGIAIAGFVAVALAAAALYFPPGGGRTIAISVLVGLLLILVLDLVSRFLLAPAAPGLRLTPVGDAAAAFMHRWVQILAGFGGLAWLLVGVVLIAGYEAGVMTWNSHVFVVLVTGAVMTLLAVIMILRCRAPVARAIIAGGVDGETDVDGAAEPAPSAMRAQLARLWHLLAIVYLVGVYGLWGWSMLAHSVSAIWAAIGSLVLLGALPIIDKAVGRLIEDLRSGPVLPALSAQGGEDGPPPEMLADSNPPGTGNPGYVGVARKGARMVLGVVAALVLLELWGVNILGGGAGDRFSNAAFDIAVSVLLAWLVWSLVRASIDRALAAREIDGETVGPSARVRTLLPLARKSVLVVLLVMLVMLTLSALGVDIGPLLAGAGVIGLAIGFGAQALVRDIVSGVFFLIDDAFRVGEYIEIGELRGEVEAISIRSMRLRHHRGPIQTIPFGELRNITNHSRDYVIYKMSIRLPYDTDVERARKIVKKIGQELMENEELGPMFLQPLKSQGITAMEDSAMIMRVKFTAKPRQQFMIRRYALRRIQEEFAKAGIEFAHRNVTVHIPFEHRDRPEDDTPAEAGGGRGGPDDHGGSGRGATAPPSLSKDTQAAVAAAAMGVIAVEEEQQQTQGGGDKR